jgi:UDP-2,3-diacylglucosamine hydrolase
MKQIFISDLHLDMHREDLTQAFFRFLREYCQDADELYILGDFFELWLGDDHETPFNQSVIDAVAALECRVYLMHGNRDFLLGDAFCKVTGAELLPEPSLINLPDGPALLMHGDSLCTRDEAYMLARAQLRSPAFQQDFLSKTLEERAAIARQIRGESKELTRDTADDIMDVTPEEVVNVMSEAGVLTLIHGHTHRPAIHDVELGQKAGHRYVLGDWDKSMQYLEVSGGAPMMKTFEF